MATGTGLDAQIGYGIESTWGTAVTVDTFFPLISETVSKDIDRVESAGIIATRQVLTTSQWAQGNATIGGGVQHELYSTGAGSLFKAAFGTMNTSGTVDTFWPATPSVSMTMQIGRPLSYGTVQPFTYEGVTVTGWEIAGDQGANVTWGMDVVAQEETMGTALATASYVSSQTPWSFTSCGLTIAGVTVPVKSFSIAGKNNVTEDRRFLGSTVISQPLRNDLAEYTGKFTCEWGNPSAQGTLNYHRFFGGTNAALVFTMASGTLSGTITATVRFDGMTPQVSGRDIITTDIPFKCNAFSTDDTAIKVTLVND